MEFKVKVIQTVIYGKTFIAGKNYNIEEIDLKILRVLNVKRAILIFKKVNKKADWIRSNFFEYESFLKKERKKEKIEIKIIDEENNSYSENKKGKGSPIKEAK